MTQHLHSATWPTVPRGCMVLVPVGSVEQHGPHLPLDTDAVIARAVADGVAARLSQSRSHRGPVLVAPSITYGASGEHQAFAGTSSVGHEALELTVIELVRSMRTWASRVVFVNAHGGNVAALTSAVDRLRSERHEVCWLACATATADAHAGFTETSLMLHLDPARVRVELAVAGDCRPLATLMPAMVEAGVVAVSPNGVLGDPRGASAEQGARILEDMVRGVAAGIPHEVLAAT